MTSAADSVDFPSGEVISVQNQKKPGSSFLLSLRFISQTAFRATASGGWRPALSGKRSSHKDGD